MLEPEAENECGKLVRIFEEAPGRSLLRTTQDSILR